MGRAVESASAGAFIGDERFTDLDFADDAVIFAESFEVLVRSLEELSNESECLGLRLSWIKTKIQVFDDFLESAANDVSEINVQGESVDIVNRFTYLGCDIRSSGGSAHEINKRLGRAYGVVESLNKGVWRSRYLCKKTKLQVFRILVLPVLLYGCETWTLNNDLRRRLDAFGTKFLRKILGYHWDDFVSNERLLNETRMKHVTCIVRERQLRHFGHVARFPDTDPVHRCLTCTCPTGWTRPRGRPRHTWL